MKRLIHMSIGALAAGAVFATSGSGATQQPCLYPTLDVWLHGGLNAQQGNYLPLPCPTTAHPKHKLVVVRHSSTSVTLEMIPK